MRQILFSVVFLSLNICVFGQSTVISISRPTVKSVPAIERANHGKITTYEGITFRLSSNYFPGSDSFQLGQPIISYRKSTPMNIELNYYYSLPDSTIRLIEYTWDASPNDTTELAKLFETNTQHFSKLFAKTGTTRREDHDTWTQKTITWQNDKNYVEQFMVTGSGTYRVRVLVSWKR